MSMFGNLKEGIGLDDQSAMEAHRFAHSPHDQYFGVAGARPQLGLPALSQQHGLFGAQPSLAALQRPQGVGAAGSNGLLSGLSAAQRASLGVVSLAQRERETEDFAASLAQSLAESDDFPALPSAKPLATHSMAEFPALSAQPAPLLHTSLGAVGERRGTAAAPSAALSQAAPVSEGQLSSALLAHLSTAATTASAPLSKDSKFGLAGLLETLRAPEKDGYSLSLGIDLKHFGLNMSSSDALYPTFASPLSDGAHDELLAKAPACYTLPHIPTIKFEQFAKFQLETLFYMFYQMPRDALQALAAQELYKRDWRFHGELKIWLKPRTQLEMQQAHPQMQFLSFDAKSFETRLFSAPPRTNLLAGIVPEEEIRVKLPLAEAS